jgi:hypothetical protein
LASRTRGLWSRTTCPITKTSLHATSSRRCTDDLLKYLANERFSPPISALPVGLQRDIRAFFGSYSNACRLADDLLFRAGSAEAVDDACRRSAVGKLLPTALYIHRTALDALEAPRAGGFELDERARTTDRIPDRQVTAKIAEQRELKRETVGALDGWIVVADEGRMARP